MPKILLAQSGSGLQFIELTCLLKVLRWPVMVSYGMVFNCSQEEFSLLLACGEGKSWITTERNLLKDPKTTSILALVKTIYYIDKTVLVENRPLVKFIRNYIWDLRSVFSTSSLGTTLCSLRSRLLMGSWLLANTVLDTRFSKYEDCFPCNLPCVLKSDDDSKWY